MVLTRKQSEGTEENKSCFLFAAASWGWNFKFNPDLLPGFETSPVLLSWPELAFIACVCLSVVGFLAGLSSFYFPSSNPDSNITTAGLY